MRKRNWPMSVNASARKMTIATKIALASMATPISRHHFTRKKWRGRRRRGAASPKGSGPLERPFILGRPGIELVLGRGLFGAVELQNRVSPHFPHASLHVMVLLVDVFAGCISRCCGKHDAVPAMSECRQRVESLSKTLLSHFDSRAL